MTVLTAFLFWLIATYLGYVTAVFSVSLLMEPDQIDSLLPTPTKSQKEFLRTLSENPVAFTHVASLFKWIALLAASILALFASAGISVASWSLAGSYGGFLLALFGVTYLALEVLPRRHSLQKVDQRFLRILPALRALFAMNNAFLRFQRRISRRRAGERISDEMREEIVERAIETLADQVGSDAELVDESERQMIGSIFRLSVVEVQEIMTPRVDIVGVRADANFEQVRALARESEHSRYPVFRESVDHIDGILHIKDVFTRPPAPGAVFSVRDHIRDPLFVPPGMKVDRLLASLRDKKCHIAIVVDEFGGTAGLVTLEDVLEVIVGDIQDEHDSEEAEIVLVGPSVWEFSGGVSMRDFSETVDAEHAIDEFETVAGLIYDLVGSVPTEGEQVSWKDYRLTILRTDGQRISRVRAERTP